MHRKNRPLSRFALILPAVCFAGAALAQAERSMLDIAAMDREVEFAKRQDALDKLRKPVAAPIAPVVPVAASAPGAAPKPRKRADTPAGIRLRSLFGVNGAKTAVFMLPSGQFVSRSAGEMVGSWRLVELRRSSAVLAKGKRFVPVEIDQPAPMAMTPDGDADIPSGPFTPPRYAGNVVDAQPLPSPRVTSQGTQLPGLAAPVPPFGPMNVSAPVQPFAGQQ